MAFISVVRLDQTTVSRYHCKTFTKAVGVGVVTRATDCLLIIFFSIV